MWAKWIGLEVAAASSPPWKHPARAFANLGVSNCGESFKAPLEGGGQKLPAAPSGKAYCPKFFTRKSKPLINNAVCTSWAWRRLCTPSGLHLEEVQFFPKTFSRSSGEIKEDPCCSIWTTFNTEKSQGVSSHEAWVLILQTNPCWSRVNYSMYIPLLPYPIAFLFQLM